MNIKYTKTEAFIAEDVKGIVCHVNRTDSENYYKACSFGRTDIGRVYFPDLANVFFYVDGRFHVDLFHGISLERKSMQDLKKLAKELWTNHPDFEEYVNKHREFFRRLAKLPDVKTRFFSRDVS